MSKVSAITLSREHDVAASDEIGNAWLNDGDGRSVRTALLQGS